MSDSCVIFASERCRKACRKPRPVLVIDDEAEIRESLDNHCCILEGYIVSSAATGARA